MTKSKQTAFRIPESLKSLAYQSIMWYAIRKNIKPENFSEYVRRLIAEDHERNQQQINARID